MNDVVQELKNALKEGVLQLKVKIIANAKQNSIEKFDCNMFKIKINKPAVDGKANKAIIEFLADILCVPKNNISIVRGEKNSIKDLRIEPKSPIM